MMIAPAIQLLWALIGLTLTTIGTFLDASAVHPPWNWTQESIHPHSLGVSYQVGAVLFTGCMGGKNAGIISQIAYLLIGLFKADIFTQGGGTSYIYQPSFGYLLGFVPGAWLCGLLAFRYLARLEFLAFSCLVGLAVIHLIGASYLLIIYALHWKSVNGVTVLQLFSIYAIAPLTGQLIVACAVTVLAFALRRLMFY